MGILGLTSLPQIRAILTVSTADLPDSVLLDYGLEDNLRADLLSWVPTWTAITDSQQETLLRLYAKYFCAAQVAETASVFILTKKSDGNNEGQRSEDGLEKLASRMRVQAGKYRAQLAKLLDSGSTTTYSPVARVTPSRDVITEGRDVS